MGGKERVIYWYDNGRYLLLVRHRVYGPPPPPHSTTPGLYLRGTLFEVQFDRQFMLAFVEASIVINDPKCNKGPNCNNFWP